MSKSSRLPASFFPTCKKKKLAVETGNEANILYMYSAPYLESRFFEKIALIVLHPTWFDARFSEVCLTASDHVYILSIHLHHTCHHITVLWFES